MAKRINFLQAENRYFFPLGGFYQNKTQFAIKNALSRSRSVIQVKNSTVHFRAFLCCKKFATFLEDDRSGSKSSQKKKKKEKKLEHITPLTTLYQCCQL